MRNSLRCSPWAVKRGKDARHRGMQLAHRKLVYTRIDAVRLYSRNRGQQRRIDHTVPPSLPVMANSTMCSPPTEAINCCGLSRAMIRP